MPKIAAVVVLYNPRINIIHNIKSYISQVDKVFAVDNSDIRDESLLEEFSELNRVEYIFNNSNIGIAAALNIGARKAINEGYEYLLTMDQDSRADPQMVDNLVLVMKSFTQIGLVSPEYLHPDVQRTIDVKYTKEILYTMSSGNLLNLDAFQKIDGFLEELFIDHVDHEYCLRLNKNGFKVFKTSNAIVYHRVGNAKEKKFFLFTFCPSNHSPLRLYYRTRNRLYVNHIYRKTFPEYVKEDIRHFIREIIEIVIYEKDLWNKLKMVLIGYNHFRKNKLGKYKIAINV